MKDYSTPSEVSLSPNNLFATSGIRDCSQFSDEIFELLRQIRAGSKVRAIDAAPLPPDELMMNDSAEDYRLA